VVNEDAAHHAGGNGKKMCAVLPRHIVRVHQAQVGLVHQRRGLQAVVRSLVGHVALRNPVQLSVDERNQPLESGFVALPPFQEQPGDLGGMVRNVRSLSPFSAF
jgi:hypothetical protein